MTTQPLTTFTANVAHFKGEKRFISNLPSSAQLVIFNIGDNGFEISAYGIRMEKDEFYSIPFPKDQLFKLNGDVDPTGNELPCRVAYAFTGSPLS